MVCINVCCRLPSRATRFQVSLECLEQPVTILSSEVSKQVNTDQTNFDILYAGQVLKPDDTLSQYSVQHQSTVYVVQKFSQPLANEASTSTEEEEASGRYKGMVTLAIQQALLNLDYRNIVERMLTEPDTVENIIAATPGLDSDPTILAMLQEPELLAVLAHPNNLDSLLKLHPSFAQTAITIATAVNEETAKSGGKHSSGSVTYSMDQMSDEDDDQPGPSRTRDTGGSRSITASQLAAALQTARGAAAQLSAGSTSPSTLQGNASASSSGSTITSDFFQQAMTHAQNASSDTALQQLREMGITDDNVARQALAATNGDIQAAIDLIFGDGFM